MAYRIMAILIPLTVISMAIAFFKETSPTASLILSKWEVRQPHERSFGHRRKMGFTVMDSAASSYNKAILAPRSLLSFWAVSLFSQSLHTRWHFLWTMGLEALFASYIVGIVGVVSIGGKILWGILSDKIGREMTYTMGTICFLLGLITLILFSIFSSPVLTYFFPIFFGMGYASTAALPPLITADFFEGRAYGGIFGWLMMFVGIGGAFGAWLAGFLYDHLGSYVPVFIIMIVVAFFSCSKYLVGRSQKNQDGAGEKKGMIRAD